MIEKLAKALHARNFPDLPWDLWDSSAHDKWRDDARCVLEVLREPDEGMIEAGRLMIQATRDHDSTGEAIAWHGFTSMIDHVLDHSGLPEGELSFPEEGPQGADGGHQSNPIPRGK